MQHKHTHILLPPSEQSPAESPGMGGWGIVSVRFQFLSLRTRKRTRDNEGFKLLILIVIRNEGSSFECDVKS